MDSVIISAFVTIFLIYISQFIRPTRIRQVDSFVSHLQAQKNSLAFAAAFSAIVAFLADYILLLSLM